MTMYADKALRCVSCGADFVFTAGEQEFHAQKGFTNEPRRCVACRQARRAGARDGDSGGRQPARTASDRNAAPRDGASAAPVATAAKPAETGRQRYTASCSACGGEAVLPFEPTGNRAVLCSACYDKIRSFA